MNITPGMEVWLKSGGPTMTTKELANGGRWTCTWFVGFEVKEHVFTKEQLTDVEPVEEDEDTF